MAKLVAVDDVMVDLERMKDVATSLGHTVLTAKDGEEGFNLIINEKPDLVLLDIVMPKMNGFQVCRELRSRPDVGDTKVIMITSKSADTDKFYGLKQGANEYLKKPFTDNDLVKLIKKYV